MLVVKEQVGCNRHRNGRQCHDQPRPPPLAYQQADSPYAGEDEDAFHPRQRGKTLGKEEENQRVHGKNTRRFVIPDVPIRNVSMYPLETDVGEELRIEGAGL